MIKGVGITTIWTLDQERTKTFFTEKLGMELRTDNGNWYSLTERSAELDLTKEWA